MKKQYYSMTNDGKEANINIYGDICSWAWEELGEMSAVNLSKKLDELGEVSKINVYINSYGGEVAEGLAIYNALKRHKAKVVTYCDGFACSIASVIFMAGDERIMNASSLLMIHNAWTKAIGNAEQLRKEADDLEKITQASVIAYKAHSTLSEEEIKSLMDKETWILPEEAFEYGFATSIEKVESTAANQNAKMHVLDIIKMHRKEARGQNGGQGNGQGVEPPDGNTGAGSAGTPPATSTPPDDTGAGGTTDEKKTAEKISGFFNALLKM